MWRKGSAIFVLLLILLPLALGRGGSASQAGLTRCPPRQIDGGSRLPPSVIREEEFSFGPPEPLLGGGGELVGLTVEGCDHLIPSGPLLLPLKASVIELSLIHI